MTCLYVVPLATIYKPFFHGLQYTNSEDRIPTISKDRILFLTETISRQVTESLNFYFLIYEVTSSSPKVPVRIKWTDRHEIAWQNVKYWIDINGMTQVILR